MVNFIWYVLGTIFVGLIIGGIIAFFIWFLNKQTREYIEKKKIPIEKIKEEVFYTKPKIDERREQEDDERRINTFRQFEKLRRSSISNNGVTEPNSFYGTTFRQPELSNVSHKVINDTKQDKLQPRAIEPKPQRRVKFD